MTSLPEKGILAVLALQETGATIPFISRYRKEMTGNLNEVDIELILKFNNLFIALLKRKAYIIDIISEQKGLSNALRDRINDCVDIDELEDLFLPFKKTKKSKADVAKKRGLLGLAKLIMSQKNDSVQIMARKFVNGSVNSVESAISGAEDIISDWIVSNPTVCEKVRKSFVNFGVLISQKLKAADDPSEKFKNFYDFSQPAYKCPGYRVLAIFRGEKEKILRVKLQPKADHNLAFMKNFFIKNQSESSEIVKAVITKAYKKILSPRYEGQAKLHYKNLADDKSILNFAKNVENILKAPPLGEKRILAIDPGFRSGCKVVCLSESNELLFNCTIYPHPPQNEKSKAIVKISQLVEGYKIQAIAIGDGTAGRETEELVKKIKFKSNICSYLVKEDGASIYSASKVAREEFPDYDVTVRGAVSIGRRLSDPLSELVKIEAKSLGVGQYQHDVNQIKLKQALDLVVEKVVNNVGVNLNTASKYLLSYVSGVGPKLAEAIVEYRLKNGQFATRNELKLVPRLGSKVFEQASGFLRIRDGIEQLDNSSIHPENYGLVHNIAKRYEIEVRDLIGNKVVLDKVKNNSEVINEVGEFTLKDIVFELNKPGIDPRLATTVFSFSDKISSISDLKIGMTVNGLITNVTDFGAFVNIGIKTNGLIHKTEIADEFINHPSDYLAIDQQVKVKVILIEPGRNRIGLSLK